MDDIKECIDIEYKQRSFLTDPIIKGYNNLLMAMYQTFLPLYQVTDNGLIPIYKPDDAYEIKRIMNLRDEYIKSAYPEITIEPGIVKNNER